MMKVLQFIPGFKFGGIETLFFEQFKYSKNSSVQLDVCVETLASEDAISELERLGCKVHVIPRFRITNIFSYMTDIYALLKNNNYNIIHSYNITRTPILFFSAIFTGI